MKVLVSGPAGHVGNNVLRELVHRGHTVRALIREDERALGTLPVERIRGDLRDIPSLEHAVAGMDAVVHTAAYLSLSASGEPLMQEVNVEGTRHLVRAAKASGVARFVHFSSIHALIQAPYDTPITETRPLALGPHFHPYDRSKALAEEIVLGENSANFSTLVLNPTAILGPWDFKPSRLGRVLMSLAKGTMPALVQAGFDWVDVRDVSLAAANALESGCSGCRYLLPGQWRSFRDFADEVSRHTGIPAPRWVVPLELAAIGAPLAEFWGMLRKEEPLFSRGALHMLRDQNQRVDGRQAMNELNHCPRPFEETVRDALKWFEEGDCGR